MEIEKAMRLLRELADLQNGPPLLKYESEWSQTMTEIYELLEEYENTTDSLRAS